MRYLIILFVSFLSLSTFAQTGIGTTTPNASAKLDVYSTNKGFLPPRVTLTSATDATTIASPAEGLLVYNLGSVGLQAGYYYWNGANWATIATATSAGNGVTSMDMVKLYSEAYSTASNKIANASGYSFTVPVSGRYLFDFSCSGWASNTTATMIFKVRQNTNDIGTDAQTSYNNIAHAEYNGKVEVNLQSGITYNVYVSHSGTRDGADYDRVYYKMVAGNLPVTGQTVDYGIARYTGADGASLSNGSIVNFDATAAGNLTWSNNKFTLMANKTYIIESSLAIYASTPSAGKFQIFDFTNNKSLGNSLFMSQGGSGINYPNANTPLKCIVTPSTNIDVGITLSGYYGAAPGIIGSTSTASTYAISNTSYFIVQQIGSSAIVNPWVLSGNDVYNTTGKVGIGNNAPTQALDVTGTGKFSSSLINGGNRTYMGKDGANMHWIASTDAIGEPNNLAYGFESNGSSIQSHKWYVGGSEKMKIASNGYVGIGTTSPATPLDVNGSVTQTLTNYYYMNRTSTGAASSYSLPVTITSSGVVKANEFDAISDFRVKKNIYSFESKNAVSFIKQLNPVTFEYIDKVQKGYKVKYGFIAQEAEKVVPNAVNKTSDFIPNIFKMVEDLGATFEIKCDDCKVGDDLKLITSKGEKLVKIVKVESTDNTKLSRIKIDWEQPEARYFVYGIKVNDFRTIDYDQLTSLSISAIQELMKQIDLLKLKQDEFNKRLLKLEANSNH